MPAGHEQLGGTSLLLVTATQPGPCNTRRGDWLVSLGVKNKWQYASVHGYRLWLSSELLSPWDLPGQWNKVKPNARAAAAAWRRQRAHPRIPPYAAPDAPKR